MRPLLIFLLAAVVTSFLLSVSILLGERAGYFPEMPTALLKATFFEDYGLKDFFLTIMVGGVALAAFVAVIYAWKYRYLLAAAAGITITGWIIQQALLAPSLLWPHYVFLLAGLAILLISFRLNARPG